MRQESLPLNNTPSTSSSSSSLDSTPIIESPLVQQVPIDLTVQEIQLEFYDPELPVKYAIYRQK
jgi:hypothetical protein